MLFEVSKIPWKIERQQEWSQQKRVQAMIRKKKMEFLKNSNYLIIRVYLSTWDPRSMSVQRISRMQRKQLRGTGFFQIVLTTFWLPAGQVVQRNSMNLRKSQISFTLVPCNRAKKHSLAQRYLAHCVSYLGLRLEAPLLELATTCKMKTHMDGLSPWELPLLLPKIFFMLLRASAACPDSLGSKAVRTAPADLRYTTAGGLPPWFIHCGPRFYLAKLLHSQYKFNAVSDTVCGYCTLTFNYIKSYYNHFLYNKSSLTPEKLSSHGCSAVFLKSKTEEF